MSAIKLAMRDQDDFPLDFFSLNLEDYHMQYDGLPDLSIDFPTTSQDIPASWSPFTSVDELFAQSCEPISPISDKSEQLSPVQTSFQVDEGGTTIDLLKGIAVSPPLTVTTTRPLSGFTGSPTKTPVFTPSVSPFSSYPSSPSYSRASPAPAISPSVVAPGTSKDGPKQRQKIPRHKRKSHIDAETRRRCKIQTAYDELKMIVPSLAEDASCLKGRHSKSAMLTKTVEFCRELREDNKGIQREANKLRQEMQALTAEITTYQLELPAQGIHNIVVLEPTVSSAERVQNMFDDYVKAKSLANWKFWIFGLVIRPLFASFNDTVSTASKETFSESMMMWVRDKMSLVSLRPTLLSTLRYLSRHTTIMTTPEKFQQEVTQAAIESTLNDPHHGDQQHMELS